MSMLRSIREKKGLTLGQLAGRVGISARVLADYEEGRQAINLAHAKLLAKALWVGIEDLIPPSGATTAEPVTAQLAPAASLEREMTNSQPVAGQNMTGTEYSQSESIRGQASTEGGREPTEGQNRRGPKAASQGSTITEGQLQEILHLALRLQLDEEKLEERVGQKVSDLKRGEAKEWIKKLRAMADEVAPGAKVKYGQWPEAREDKEAIYLREQKEAGEPFLFKLFNGETFTGVICDFTAYTITIKQEAEEVVLRKLAIAYYRKLHGEEKQMSEQTKEKENEETQDPRPHDHARDDSRQPLDRGIDSDRVGTPDTPEQDRMDKDRGA